MGLGATADAQTALVFTIRCTLVAYLGGRQRLIIVTKVARPIRSKWLLIEHQSRTVPLLVLLLLVGMVCKDWHQLVLNILG